MTTDPLCRWAQPLGGRHDGECDEAAVPGRRFCARHGEILARVSAAPPRKPGERPIHGANELAPVVTRHVEPRPAARKLRSPQIAPDLLADDIVAYIDAAEKYPVNRSTLCEHFSRSMRTITRAVAIAVADDRVKVQTYGRPDTRGYYKPGTEPTIAVDNTNLAEAA